ncbi:GNAT family N-acetyltransferase [Inquilinus sp.]|jgi:GNAT superfamily N-acetyltransferase|uniref:GNAT family N-acetyltransferase n=1 Tax=Inquilinus sp. TaxID=1932117 RepID=UPI003782FCB1
MIGQFAIREVLEADLDGLARVVVNTVRFGYRGYFPDDFLEALTPEKERESRRLAILVPGSFCFAAIDESQQQIVGLAYGAPRKGLNQFNRSVLEDLYVLPNYQGFGIGAELFWAFAAEHQKHGRKDLLARSFIDHPSSAFYEYMGGKLLTLAPRLFGSKKVNELEYMWELDDLRRLRRATKSGHG